MKWKRKLKKKDFLFPERISATLAILALGPAGTNTVHPSTTIVRFDFERFAEIIYLFLFIE